MKFIKGDSCCRVDGGMKHCPTSVVKLDAQSGLQEPVRHAVGQVIPEQHKRAWELNSLMCPLSI